MSQQERTEQNKLVERYIATWHEADARVRRQNIEQLWVEDGVQFLSTREYRGYEALEERFASAHAEFVKTGGFIFQKSGEAEENHGALTLSWEMMPAGGGDVAATGTIFFLLDESGRIRFDYQF